MNTAVGFTAILHGTPQNIQAARLSLGRALAHFDNLGQLSINIGNTELHLWGRGKLSDCMHYLPNGSLLARIGSPGGEISWRELQEKLYKAAQPSDFELPWDGRVILLMISADGNQWTLWNDWLGSMPVFHAPLGAGHIASTLEPIVVSAAGFTPHDISIHGLVYLLIHGHFASDWTLFNDMNVVPPDCVAEWKGGGFYFNPCNTIKPTDARWEVGWDELVDEMHHLSRQAIVDVLKMRPTWILPLSGGLDSRLIAAVGASLGIDMHTYSWGARQSSDATYARQIARTLDLPWKWIDLGTDYMQKYTRLWSDLFGSAMHFHGMYQMPFYDALKSEPSGPIASGFIGESLAG